MKKFVAVMVVAFVAAFSVSICSAYDQNHYPNDPYDYNSNYMYIFEAMGRTKYYLDLNSVDVQEYNPPHDQIAGQMVSYSDYYDKTNEPIYVVIRYNWYTKESFHLNDYGYWVKDEIDGNYNAVIHRRKTVDALFRAAYNMDFYGY